MSSSASSPSYRVSRAGKIVGEFELPQVKQMFEAGLLQPTDHAWTAGMQDWQALAVLFPAMSPPPPPLPPRAPASPPPAASAQPAAPNAALALVVPLGRSGWAILAGYLGLLSLLVLPAPFAILCGVLAIKDINKNPHKLGLVRAWFGIIAGSLALLVTLLLMVYGSMK